MRKLLNTLFVTSEDVYLALENENVIVYREDEKAAQYPLQMLESILCFSYKGASPALMGACVRQGVQLSFLTPGGRMLARAAGMSQGNVLLRKEQYRVSDQPERSCLVARNMIFGKAYNARWVMERTLRDHAMRVEEGRLREASAHLQQQLRPLLSADSLDVLRGLEGEASACYFGVLDEVLADYRSFKESYESVAGESCRRFERDYEAYCSAMEKGDSFAAAGIMDSGLLDEIVGQLAAVQDVEKPATDAIDALWDLMFEYADMMDTAGYYYKRISLSTYVVTRRYYRALFEDRLGKAHTLYEEFRRQTAVYDGLLENWAQK